VEHERREHPIERRVGIIERIGEPAIELDARPNALSLACRSSERLLVRIQTNDFHVRERLLGEDDEASGPASDVKHTVARAELRLDYQVSSRPVES
jgi:hypothetical protein